MHKTTTIAVRRGLALVLLLVTSVGLAEAQQPPVSGAPRHPACARLEAQLSAFDRGGNVDPQRAEQIRRYEEAAGKQQQELDRLVAQARRTGCEGRGFFSLFGGQPQECGPLNNRIQQMRANLDRVLNDLQRLQGNSADREGERRAILASLAQNDCGQQYKQFVSRGGSGGGGNFFENLFGGGPGTIITPPNAQQPSTSGETFRTVCVRTCDGFYFPISYSTVPANFAHDAQVCQRMCPAAQVQLYSHRNPGEDMAQAVSSEGQPYSQLPTAFAYRKQVDPSCSCRAAGQTWADALKNVEDTGLEQGDIVVTEERAKTLSAPIDPNKGKAQAKGKGAQPKGKTEPPVAETPPTPPAPPNGEGGKRSIRTVGPPFLPAK